MTQDYGFLNANLNAAAKPVSVNYRSWFNEANESTWYLVSAEYVGILGLICLFMVAVVISREWDRGTIASLYNSNASALEIVTAKSASYYFLALFGRCDDARLRAGAFGHSRSADSVANAAGDALRLRCWEE